jgi:hypothetical protein
MTGRRYYVSTATGWRRHSGRFTSSHWLSLPQAKSDGQKGTDATDEAAAADSPILVLVEADEGAHLALEDDPAFEPLPHPLAQTSISTSAQKTLESLGVPANATTLDVAKALARFHPLLRHTVF